jgi:hypothetical protein
MVKQCRWYLRALGRHPLVRSTDRAEALSVLAVVVLALIAIPMATMLYDQTYVDRMNTVAEQAQTRHSVQATVVHGSTGLPTDFDTPAYVTAQWKEGSEVRSEQIVSPATVATGESLTVWLDDDGTVTGAPLQPVDAELSALGIAVVAWGLGVLFLIFGATAIRRILDRLRDRAWERELRLLTYNDDGWANRHP